MNTIESCVDSGARRKNQDRPGLGVVSVASLTNIVAEHPELRHEHRKLIDQLIWQNSDRHFGACWSESMVEDAGGLGLPTGSASNKTEKSTFQQNGTSGYSLIDVSCRLCRLGEQPMMRLKALLNALSDA